MMENLKISRDKRSVSMKNDFSWRYYMSSARKIISPASVFLFFNPLDDWHAIFIRSCNTYAQKNKAFPINLITNEK